MSLSRNTVYATSDNHHMCIISSNNIFLLITNFMIIINDHQADIVLIMDHQADIVCNILDKLGRNLEFASCLLHFCAASQVW